MKHIPRKTTGFENMGTGADWRISGVSDGGLLIASLIERMLTNLKKGMFVVKSIAGNLLLKPQNEGIARRIPIIGINGISLHNLFHACTYLDPIFQNL